MENDKPTYEQIEQELNEYKELLWQLSDEYKLNLGNAEKALEEEKQRFIEFQKKQTLVPGVEHTDFLSKLGLPSCIFGKDGDLVKHNNKFKFLVELLGFEIEDLKNIETLFALNKLDNLPERFKNFLDNDEGLLQSLFRVENPFKGIINLLVRIYTIPDSNENLALFVELNNTEIQTLTSNLPLHQSNKEIVAKDKHETGDEEYLNLKTEIAVFSEKYELFEEIMKSAEFSGDQLNESKTIGLLLKKYFNIENNRSKILDKLTSQFKNFISSINKVYPELTSNEEKHCLLIKAGLSYKEIAALMGISINGVKIARNRLRKKFELENDTKTSDFIDNL